MVECHSVDRREQDLGVALPHAVIAGTVLDQRARQLLEIVGLADLAEQIHLRVDADADRDALHHLDPVAGGVLCGQQRERRMCCPNCTLRSVT